MYCVFVNKATYWSIGNIIDFYIAHLLEIECVKQCIDRGITPPVWSSANTPGGDEKNAALYEKYYGYWK